MATGSVSHDRQKETPEAKARWFQSLSLSERMDLLVAFTDLALANDPKIMERRHAQPVPGRVRVVSKPDLSARMRAAGRQVDIDDVRLLELEVQEGGDGSA